MSPPRHRPSPPAPLATTDAPAWIRATPKGAVLQIRVTPRAKRDGIEGAPEGDRLRVRLRAPPVEGKANAALVALLADATGVPRARWRLLAGDAARDKRVLAVAADAASIRRILLNPP